MIPEGVLSGVPEVYSNDAPGVSTGCSPTTPSPWISWTWPMESVIRQWRVINCTVLWPLFSIRT